MIEARLLKVMLVQNARVNGSLVIISYAALGGMAVLIIDILLQRLFPQLFDAWLWSRLFGWPLLAGIAALPYLLRRRSGALAGGTALQPVSGQAPTQDVGRCAPLPMAVLDGAGLVTYWNPAAEDLTGWTREEMLGRTLPWADDASRHGSRMLPPASATDALKGCWEEQLRHRDGRLLDVHLFGASLDRSGGDPAGYVCQFLDISEQKLAQAKVAFLAHHDQLTRLPNRNMLHERFNQATMHALRTHTRLAICLLDLDHFKQINDLLGHHKGDRLLCQVAQRLSLSVRRSDTVCRMGGDEFVLLLTNTGEVVEVAALARKIMQQFEDPFPLGEHAPKVTVSMGISIFPDDGLEFEALFKNADAAMYLAKDAGRANFQFFREEINVQVQQRILIEKGLRQALQENRLAMYYQAICEVDSRRPVAMESLVRWRHPEWGVLSPGQFLPVIEDSDLMLAVGRWILTEVCHQLHCWRRQGLTLTTVSVNVTARQLFQPGFPQWLGHVLEKYGLEPEWLALEFTESVFSDARHSVQAVLEELRTMGVELILDDFGVGCSSLSLLKQLPVERLKIDRSLLETIGKDGQGAMMTASIIQMARNLGLQVLAEGVETAEQLNFLQSHHCDLAQGYLLGRPMQAEEIIGVFLPKGGVG
jgi:diguanylate cyclase (GGDEF)-like protein/PAS domain S-box-containing protein